MVFYNESEDIYKFYCEFLDKKNVHSLSLIKKKGIRTLQVKATEFINSSEHFTNDAVQFLKFHGSYQQDNRENRSPG